MNISKKRSITFIIIEGLLINIERLSVFMPLLWSWQVLSICSFAFFFVNDLNSCENKTAFKINVYLKDNIIFQQFLIILFYISHNICCYMCIHIIIQEMLHLLLDRYCINYLCPITVVSFAYIFHALNVTIIMEQR